MLSPSSASSSNSSSRSLAGVATGRVRLSSASAQTASSASPGRAHAAKSAPNTSFRPSSVASTPYVFSKRHRSYSSLNRRNSASVGSRSAQTEPLAAKSARRCAGIVFSCSAGPTGAETRGPGPTSSTHLGEASSSLSPALSTKA
uniref:Uncharacterized protein n=1 Tax=Arundo donax TaxID=35708 RepID=A0A0A9CQJ1_ARUDO